MVETRKSIIDEAFMEAESIEQAFKANSKEILSHTMGSEIEEMVKESLEDSVALNEDEDDENVDLELDLGLDSDEAGEDAGDDLDLELGDEGDEIEMDDEDMEMDSEDLEIVDLTDADDETVVNVFKKMADEDEIEVVQTEDGVEIKDNETGAEYKIELGGDSEMEMDLEDMEDMDDEDMDMDDEEVEYHIELDGEEDMDDDMSEGDYMDDDMSEGDYMEDGMEEASRTLGAGKRFGRKGLDKPKAAPKHLKVESEKPKFLKLVNENKVLKNKISSIASENETLKEDYNKMVDALKEFRQKLNEVAVFNSNLTYSVRLFTEHSTTKEEKVDIIKRFDDAKTLKESKTTYKNLVKEISKTKAPIKESIEEKLNETKSSGSATEITESKVYVDPQIEKMKALWNYEYKN